MWILFNVGRQKSVLSKNFQQIQRIDWRLVINERVMQTETNLIQQIIDREPCILFFYWLRCMDNGVSVAFCPSDERTYLRLTALSIVTTHATAFRFALTDYFFLFFPCSLVTPAYSTWLYVLNDVQQLVWLVPKLFETAIIQSVRFNSPRRTSDSSKRHKIQVDIYTINFKQRRVELNIKTIGLHVSSASWLKRKATAWDNNKNQLSTCSRSYLLYVQLR